jgi:prolyl oligopeptidase
VKSYGAGPEGDPRSWLEEPRGSKALEWVRAQNKQTLAALEADPRFSRYRAAALRAANDDGALAGSSFHTGRIVNGWVHGLLKDAAHPLGVWRRAKMESFLSAEPQWDILLDLDRLSMTEGRRWDFRLGGLECLDAPRERCLVWLADGGRLEGAVREFDLATRSFVVDGFNLPEAVSRAVWWDANTVLVSTDSLRREHSKDGTANFSKSGYPIDVRMWKRDQALRAAKVIFQGGPETASTWPDRYVDVDGQSLVIVSSYDWQGNLGSWLVDSRADLRRMTLPPSRLQTALHRGHCVTVLLEPWSVAGQTFPAGALISVSLDGITEASPTILAMKIPDAREAVYDVWSTRSGVLVSSSHNVSGRLESFNLNKGRWKRRAIALPDHGTIRVSMADSRSAKAFVTYQDFLQPITLFVADAAAARVQALRSAGAPMDRQRFVTEQFEASSSDGAKIPYFVVRDRDLKFDGSSPTLLNGYGGFGVPQYPRYSGVVSRLWLEQGGTYVLANIRGGSEFGPAWHKAAIGPNRQRAYDDFIAVAEDLIRRKITSPRRLGIEGMSNGGLLVGVMLNQRPELFHAAVAKVPVLDLLRWDLLHGGAYTANELGSLDIPEELAFLTRTSPYHNLRVRPDFPVPLLMAATDDDNVHPAQARKYVAKAQELGIAVLYYESEEGGHGAALTPAGRAQNDAVEFVYLARALMD